MNNKINILSPLKIGLLSFFFILSSATYASTYYVDSVKGNDNNGGTTEEQAWKTVAKISAHSFQPGDVIAFKRNQIFKGRLSISSSGVSGNSITFTSYGDGTKPIITGFGKITGTWVNEGSNKWSLATSYKVLRLHKNGIEQKTIGTDSGTPKWSEFGDQVYNGNYIWYNYKLYFYSTVNPSIYTFTGTTQSSVVTLDNADYVDIVELDLQGGSSHVLKLTNGCSNNNIKYNNIGMLAGYGMVFNTVDNCIIERNTVDSGLRINYDGFDNSYRGASNRGVSDGFVNYGGFTDSEVRYNNFIDWGHASFAFSITSSTFTKNNKIHHNIFSSPSLAYSRGFSFSGDYCTNNEFYNNYVHKMTVRSQINGKNNHIHHNWVEDIKNTTLKKGEEGQAFAYENYNGNPTGNIFEYNTISNIEGPGIEFIASGNSSKDISNNTIRKNLFINCGKNPYYSKGIGKGIYVQDYVDIRANNFYDNSISSTLTSDTVYHRGIQLTPLELNGRNEINGDKISGNTSTVTDQGAGSLDIATIGVNAGYKSTTTDVNMDSSIIEEDAELKGAFVMTRNGLN